MCTITHSFVWNAALHEALRALRASADAHRASSSLRCDGYIIFKWLCIFTHICVLHSYNALREVLRALHVSADAHRASSSLRCEGYIIYTFIYLHTHDYMFTHTCLHM